MLSKILTVIKPIFTVIVVVVVLRATGLVSGLTETAQSGLLQTGLLDAKTDDDATKDDDFDYNFMVKDLQGKKVSIGQYKGKVIFLNLWATWCGPCRAEMPTIQKLYDGVSKDNIVFVILSLDRDQDLPKIEQYVKSKSYSFPVYQPSGTLTAQLDIPSIPATFVISKAGKIIAKEVGTTNFNTSKFKNFLEAEAKR